MEELKILGENLYHFRKKNNLSYQAVADTLGLSAAHICRIENGTAKPSFDVLIQISQMMRVPLYYLFVNPDETPDLSDFITQIQKYLLECNGSPAKLAQVTGVNQFKLVDFLQGKTQLTRNELTSIAQTLHLPKPVDPVSQRLTLLEQLLCDFGLDQEQVQNVTEYVQSVHRSAQP